MTTTLDVRTEISFAAKEQVMTPEFRERCDTLGLDIDRLSMRELPVVEAVVNYARDAYSLAIGLYFEKPAAALEVLPSQVEGTLVAHLRDARKQLDQTPIFDAIDAVALNDADHQRIQEQTRVIIGGFLTTMRIRATRNVIAIGSGDPEEHEKAAPYFAEYGYELKGMPVSESVAPEAPRQEVIVPVHASHHNRPSRLVISGAAGLAAISAVVGVAGPAAAKEGDPSVINLGPDGQIVATAPATPQATTAPDNGANAAPTPSASSIPNILPSAPASVAPTSSPTAEVVTPTVPAETPSVSPSVPSTETPSSSTPAVETPLPSAPDNNTGPQVPKKLPSTPEALPVKAPIDTPQTATENSQTAEALLPKFASEIEPALTAVQKTLASGNMHDMTQNPNDVFATKDPSNPQKFINMPLTAEQKTALSDNYNYVQGVIANDTEVIGIILDRYEMLNVKLPIDQAKLAQVRFMEAGQPDLTIDQKVALIYLMGDMNEPLITAADQYVKDANEAYQKAQEAAKKAAADKAAKEKASSGEFTTNPYGLGTVRITDRAEFIKLANAYIYSKAPNSPMNGMAEDFLKGAEENNISVGVLLIGADLESQFCSDGHSVCVTHHTFNAWNRECPTDKPSTPYTDGDSEFHHNACDWMSFVDSLLRNDFHGAMAPHHGYDSMGQYIHRKFIEHGITDIAGMLGEFTPAHETGVARHTQVVQMWLDQLDDFWAHMGNTVSFAPVAKKHVGPDVGANPNEGNSNSKFTDSETITIPHAQEALDVGAGLVRLTKKAMKTGEISSFKGACPRDDPEHRCSGLCDHIAAYLWGDEHSGHDSARLHRIEMDNQGRLHNGDDKYEPAVGSFMFWGTKGWGHAAIYAGNGMVYSTSIYDKKNGFDGGVYLAKATDITKLWGLQYTGWANDPGLSHAKSVVS